MGVQTARELAQFYSTNLFVTTDEYSDCLPSLLSSNYMRPIYKERSCRLQVWSGEKRKNSSVPFGSLLHLQSEQTGFGTAGSLAVVSTLLVESITALVQGINLCLAFVFVE